MRSATRQPLSLRLVIAIFGAWTLVALVFAFIFIGDMLAMSEPVNWRSSLLLNLVRFYIWAVFTLLLVGLARRFPFEQRRRWPQYLAVYLPTGLVLVAVHLFFYGLAMRAIDEWSQQNYASIFDLYRRLFFRSLPNNLLIYLLTVVAIQASFYYRRFREAETRAAKLDAQLAEAQLVALKMQLHPHFLFNTLHAVSALMEEDIKAARRVIARLSELLRLTLDSAGRQEVSLERELEVLGRYLEIERIRFQDRLRVDFEIAPATLAARVPNLILQPIVENAIRHAVAPLSTPVRIEVCAGLEDGRLRLSVRDDGPGLAPVAAGGADGGIVPKGGIGLTNTRARLQQLYGDAQRFEIRNAAGGGVEVTLEFPFRSDRLPEDMPQDMPPEEAEAGMLERRAVRGAKQ